LPPCACRFHRVPPHEIRRESGVSQEHLALEAGFERTYVSLIERGLKSPTIRALVRLAEALQVRPSKCAIRPDTQSAAR